MSVFKTSKVFPVTVADLSPVAEAVMYHFQRQGFEVESTRTLTSGFDIGVRKGGVFKAVLGLRTSLKIHIERTGNSTVAEAGIGIFGQQAVPTAISMLIFWPVLVTQIWGIVKQAHLDDEAMSVIENTLATIAPPVLPTTNTVAIATFCSTCGAMPSQGAKFCPACGARLP
jgi:hypothetical protein